MDANKDEMEWSEAMAVVAEERTRARRTGNRKQDGRGTIAGLDYGLARRAERKLRRYGQSLNGAFAAIVNRRGMIDELRTEPFSLDFTVQGQRFTADITPDPCGRFCAQVRGHENCFTEGGSIPELRQALVEVVELMLFDIGEEVHE